MPGVQGGRQNHQMQRGLWCMHSGTNKPADARLLCVSIATALTHPTQCWCCQHSEQKVLVEACSRQLMAVAHCVLVIGSCWPLAKCTTPPCRMPDGPIAQPYTRSPNQHAAHCRGAALAIPDTPAAHLSSLSSPSHPGPLRENPRRCVEHAATQQSYQQPCRALSATDRRDQLVCAGSCSA